MQMNGYGWLFGLAGAVSLSCLADGVGDQTPENPSVQHIQRTMRQLNSETGPGEPVKILFYGQSITAQPWTLAVARVLRSRFPDIRWNMQFVNRAVGGYQADKLSRIAEALLYPEYPDLVIFHDYGKLEYVEEMIRRLREETTAEIVIWTSHVRVSGEHAKEWQEEHPIFGWDDERRNEGFRRIARKHDCLLIDVRKMWKEHLAKTGEAPAAYLKDVIHLNEKGNKLLAQMIGRELVRTTKYGEGGSARSVSRVPVETHMPFVLRALPRGSELIHMPFVLRALPRGSELIHMPFVLRALPRGSELTHMPFVLRALPRGSELTHMPFVLRALPRGSEMIHMPFVLRALPRGSELIHAIVLRALPRGSELIHMLFVLRALP